MKGKKKVFLAMLLSLCMFFAMGNFQIVSAEGILGRSDSSVKEQPLMQGTLEGDAISGLGAEDSANNDELFEAWAWQQFYDNSGVSLFADYGQNKLSGSSLELYNELKGVVSEIARGDRAATTIQWKDYFVCYWSFEELGVSSLDSEEEIKAVVRQKVSEIFFCLLADCPYELYWMDKTIGFSYYTDYNVLETGLAIGFPEMTFAVAEAYRANGDPYTVDTAKAKATVTAVENAKKVVAANEGKSDYEKLLAYQEYICKVAEYNTEAMEDVNTPYGDPWQLIWVFDEDLSTNVVCEGYAKAFQYLCDLSGFQSDEIVCYTVTGDLGVVNESGIPAGAAEPHMWNIVTMDNGKNYLVDVTNSDDGEHAANMLFLDGTNDWDAAEHMYTFWYIYGGTDVIGFTYTYDQITLGLYTDAELLLDGDVYQLPHVHTPGATVRENEKKATCTEAGSYEEVVYCTSCGAEISRETKTIESLGHDYQVTQEAKEPTCTEDGLTAKMECSRCKDQIGGELVPAKGHQFGDMEIKKKPTCTEEGLAEGTCIVCGEHTTQAVEPLGHDYVVTKEAKEPTCTEDGNTEGKSCSRCDSVIVPQVIQALGHDYKVTKEAKEPTCTEDGNTEEQTCTRCHFAFGGETRKALGHDYVVTKEAKKATCTENGNMEERTCRRCHMVVGGGVIQAPGHQVEEWKVTEKPTCKDAGSEEGICSVCGEKVTRAIAALGHKWDDGKITKEAAVGEDGEKLFTCTVCGETKTEVIPALPKDQGSGTVGTDQNGQPPVTAPKTNDYQLQIWMLVAVVILAGGSGVFVTVRRRKSDK